ncbi:MAG: hypothetical protein EZS28_049504 [Streblomastix strix]|uniref:Uncharacterized protein n=1 Tax=Streblomastix strix TaxID=222440 RepID=A0A5J4T9X3_9EUKA|nr:MAG: hypothetical protein EZS28_049504 [Streblomastix strix]
MKCRIKALGQILSDSNAIWRTPTYQKHLAPVTLRKRIQEELIVSGVPISFGLNTIRHAVQQEQQLKNSSAIYPVTKIHTQQNFLEDSQQKEILPYGLFGQKLEHSGLVLGNKPQYVESPFITPSQCYVFFLRLIRTRPNTRQILRHVCTVEYG